MFTIKFSHLIARVEYWIQDDRKSPSNGHLMVYRLFSGSHFNVFVHLNRPFRRSISLAESHFKVHIGYVHKDSLTLNPLHVDAD